MTIKRRRYDDDSENVSITSKIPRFDHSFVHREKEDKDLGLGENRPIQGRGWAGTVKLGTTVVSDDERVVIGSRRQTTPSQQITKQVADVSKGSRSSRVELLKFRFRTLIQKSQKQLLYGDGAGETDGQEMAVAISVSETRKRDESSSNSRKRKREIEKLRKAAREKIESITRTVDFPNNLEAMSDMAKIMGDSSWYFYGYGGGRKCCCRSTNKQTPLDR